MKNCSCLYVSCISTCNYSLFTTKLVSKSLFGKIHEGDIKRMDNLVKHMNSISKIGLI